MSLFLGQEVLELLLDSVSVRESVASWFSRGAADEVRRMVGLLKKAIMGYPSQL